MRGHPASVILQQTIHEDRAGIQEITVDNFHQAVECNALCSGLYLIV